MTYSWPERALLAECDPSGGSVLAGHLSGRMPPAPGLLELGLALAHNTDPEVVWQHLVRVDPSVRWRLLPGLQDPRQAAQLDGVWPAIAEALVTAMGDQADVLLDLGRIGDRETPYALLGAVDLLCMVVRPTLRQVDAARHRLEALGYGPGGQGALPVALCVVGEGPYKYWEVSEALDGLPVVGRLPADAQAAAYFSDGIVPRRWTRVTTFLQAATGLVVALRRMAEPAQAARRPASAGSGRRSGR
ncbi:hypothetical protein [Sphaerisporangium flaviroseum]|uniref:hypothetical protein n=1 Tax=Sphaerisporangium flaviroseum TaxID=509199 RepID=UPI0031E95873